MSFLFQVFGLSITINLNARDEKVELALKERQKVWKPTNEDLLMSLELLRKEKDEKEEECVAEIAEGIAEVRGSVVVAVWEAKIKLAEDVANTGSWNVVGCYEALDKLTGELFNTIQDPAKQLKVGGEEEEAEKVPGGDDQTVV